MAAGAGSFFLGKPELSSAVEPLLVGFTPVPTGDALIFLELLLAVSWLSTNREALPFPDADFVAAGSSLGEDVVWEKLKGLLKNSATVAKTKYLKLLLCISRPPRLDVSSNKSIQGNSKNEGPASIASSGCDNFVAAADGKWYFRCTAQKRISLGQPKKLATNGSFFMSEAKGCPPIIGRGW
jgi:hypothetical protein